MKYKLKVCGLFLIASLALASCAPKEDTPVNSNKSNTPDNKVIQDKKVKPQKKVQKKFTTKDILLNTNESNASLEQISGENEFVSKNLSLYGLSEQDNFDGITVKQIIERALEQDGKKVNRSVHFKQYYNGNNDMNIYHDQDNKGRYRVVREENMPSEGFIGGYTISDGNKLEVLPPDYLYRESEELSQPFGVLSGDEIFNEMKNFKVKGYVLDEFDFDGDHVNVADFPVTPGIKVSVEGIKSGYDFGEGSFIRLKDGFKDDTQKLNTAKDNVYHVIYSDEHSKYEFFINKDTYLVEYEEYISNNNTYISKIVSYSEDKEYPKGFFSVKDPL